MLELGGSGNYIRDKEAKDLNTGRHNMQTMEHEHWCFVTQFLIM